MKCVGLRKFMYTSKKTGASYPAANLFYTDDQTPMDGLQGMQAGSLFVKQEIIPDGLTVGSDFYVYYNRFGSVDVIGIPKQA